MRESLQEPRAVNFPSILNTVVRGRCYETAGWRKTGILARIENLFQETSDMWRAHNE
jgi:hypothetical protein